MKALSIQRDIDSFCDSVIQKLGALRQKALLKLKEGDLAQAAGYTDHPAAALAALTTYQKYLHLKKVTGTAGTATPVTATSAALSRCRWSVWTT